MSCIPRANKKNTLTPKNTYEIIAKLVTDTANVTTEDKGPK